MWIYLQRHEPVPNRLAIWCRWQVYCANKLRATWDYRRDELEFSNTPDWCRIAQMARAIGAMSTQGHVLFPTQRASCHRCPKRPLCHRPISARMSPTPSGRPMCESLRPCECPKQWDCNPSNRKWLVFCLWQTRPHRSLRHYGRPAPAPICHRSPAILSATYHANRLSRTMNRPLSRRTLSPPNAKHCISRLHASMTKFSGCYRHLCKPE